MKTNTMKIVCAVFPAKLTRNRNKNTLVRCLLAPLIVAMNIAIGIILLFACQTVAADLLSGAKRKRTEYEGPTVEVSQIGQQRIDNPRTRHEHQIVKIQNELIDAVKGRNSKPLIKYSSVFGVNSEVIINVLERLVDEDDGDSVFFIANT